MSYRRCSITDCGRVMRTPARDAPEQEPRAYHGLACSRCMRKMRGRKYQLGLKDGDLRKIVLAPPKPWFKGEGDVQFTVAVPPGAGLLTMVMSAAAANVLVAEGPQGQIPLRLNWTLSTGAEPVMGIAALVASDAR